MDSRPIDRGPDMPWSASELHPNARASGPPPDSGPVPSHAVRRTARPESGLDDVTVRWSDAWVLVSCYVGLVAAWYLAGIAITNSPTIITEVDDSVAEWFVDRRTPALDAASLLGSHLAETVVKVAATAVLAVGMKLAWKRWREPLMVVLPLVLEACAFITITIFVDRSRPDVERLDSSPVGSSFPSGHVAAAAAYAAVIIIVYWHTSNRWWRRMAVASTATVVVVVAAARLYRGMHFITDVVAGALLGLASVAVCWWIIQRAIRRPGELQSSRP
jgi:membrane-associated phospholipid phosphatase